MNNKPESITHTKVAIITVTYNSESFINEYLASLIPFLENTEHQLILVDNQSSDNTLGLLDAFIKQNKQLQDQIKVIPLEQNIGFGKGCNKGAVAAQEYKPTYLWFLNPDTKVFEDSGSELLALLDKKPDVDFVGSILINEKSEIRAGAFRFPTLTNVFVSAMGIGIVDKLFHRCHTSIPVKQTPYEADWLTGASFMVKNSSFNTLKGFEPYYFLYFEEVDLFYRAKQLGFSVWACPDSKVFHISGASTGINDHKTQAKRKPKYWYESRRYFYMSNFGKLYFTAVDMALIFSHLVWRAKIKIQGQKNTAPLHYIRDILRHSYLFSFWGKSK
ncbi:MAG: glycosyltransferase family 2 protein [Cellvibrionaceae bacterium]